MRVTRCHKVSTNREHSTWNDEPEICQNALARSQRAAEWRQQSRDWIIDQARRITKVSEAGGSVAASEFWLEQISATRPYIKYEGRGGLRELFRDLEGAVVCRRELRSVR